MSTPKQLGLLLCTTLAAALSGTANADDLGRLLTSPAERARIDTRDTHTPGQGNASLSESAERIVINGTLRGSDGKRLVWVNGSPLQPNRNNAITLLHDGRVKMTWRNGAKTLKPGQGIDQASGKIFDHATPAAAVTPSPAAVATDTTGASDPAKTAPVTPAEAKITDAAKPVATAEAKAK